MLNAFTSADAPYFHMLKYGMLNINICNSFGIRETHER